MKNWPPSTYVWVGAYLLLAAVLYCLFLRP